MTAGNLSIRFKYFLNIFSTPILLPLRAQKWLGHLQHCHNWNGCCLHPMKNAAKQKFVKIIPY